MATDYTPIPGLGTGRGSFQAATRVRVYAGPDHLLLVTGSGYTEDYKRVFFRDIRYVVARKDNFQAIVLGFISGGLFLAATLLNFTRVPWWIPDLIGAPFLIWFVMNWVWGATCRCYVSTDVQTLALPTPQRVNKFPILIAFLNEKISPAQPAVEPVITAPNP